jgi:hypothetical protein
MCVGDITRAAASSVGLACAYTFTGTNATCMLGSMQQPGYTLCGTHPVDHGECHRAQTQQLSCGVSADAASWDFPGNLSMLGICACMCERLQLISSVLCVAACPVLCCGSTELVYQWQAYTGTFQRVGHHLQLLGLLYCSACQGVGTVCQQQPDMLPRCVF